MAENKGLVPKLSQEGLIVGGRRKGIIWIGGIIG